MNRRSFLRGLLIAPVAGPAMVRHASGPPLYAPYGFYGGAELQAGMAGQMAMPKTIPFPQLGEWIETPYGYDTGWIGGCVCDGLRVDLWGRVD